MTHADALTFLGSAGPWRGTWADIGAGSGTFTRALAELIGPQGTVIAVDRDRHVLAQLQNDASRSAGTAARVVTARGDVQELASIAELQNVELDGALFANILHFMSRPAPVLAAVAERLRQGGRIIVIEYDRRAANPWVPHPLPFDRLTDVARRAGLGAPVEVARRPSSYHREMYCAVLTG